MPGGMLLLSNFLPFFLLIGISFKDLKEGRIPDILLVSLGLLSVLQFEENHLLSVIGLGLIGLALKKGYLTLKKQEGLGWGDVKMMTISGLWITPSEVPLFLLLTGVAGALTALIYGRRRFPLGPALAFALGTCMVRTIIL